MLVLLFALTLLQGSPADKGIAAFKAGDFAEARTILQPLADKGDGLAQYYIGLMYQRGVAYPRNYVRAHMWFNLSAASGVPAAPAARDEVEKQMTPQQRAEAERLALDWRPLSDAPPPPPPSPPPTQSGEPVRTPSRGPASEKSAPDARADAPIDAFVEYLSARVRSENSREYSVPTVRVSACVLTVEYDWYLDADSTVRVTSTVDVGRIKSVGSSDFDGVRFAALHASSQSDVLHSRSTGRERTSSVLQVPVRSGFDFSAFRTLTEQAAAACR